MNTLYIFTVFLVLFIMYFLSKQNLIIYFGHLFLTNDKLTEKSKSTLLSLFVSNRMFTLNLDSMCTSLETSQASRCQGLFSRRCTIIRMPSKDNEALYNIIDSNEPWKGRMLFTGPDGNKDHTMTIDPEHRQIGIGTMSWEGTSETDYLWRPATGTPFHKSRGKNVGEVGWCVPQKADWQVPQSGKQIMLGQFRQACEDRHSHLYQNAWYPGPNEEIPENSDAALVMNVFRPKTTQQNKSEQESSESNTSAQ